MNNMEFIGKLPIPQEIKEQYPLSAAAAQVKAARDEEIAKVFIGEDSRMLLIIGPCSADREDAVLEYVGRLRTVQEQVADKLVIIPRIFTNKPRTTGDGYKGMLHYPDPNAKPDLIKGVIAARQLYMKALETYGLPSANEMLYPENHRYWNDLLSYAVVGARSVENQQHRLTSSGLSIPVGMKNPTGGDLSVMLNAIHAGQQKHTFCYRNWEVRSAGNPLTHAVLRGFVDHNGVMYPNYRYEDLQRLCDLYEGAQLQNPAVIIDTNHCNSGKQHLEQISVVRDVLRSCKEDARIRKLMKGFMIESYLVDGCQPVGGDVFGQSITDPCLGWEKTERLIYDIADAL